MRLPNLQTITFAKNENVQVRLAKDSTLFLLVKTKQITRVINARTLREVFRTEHTPEPILQNIFLFEKKGKKGLLDNTGKIILQPIYDAIVYNQTTLSLLKDNLFGAFRISSKKTIKQQFESNLRPIGAKYFAVKKKTGWGFISDAGKPISKFVYDDIQPWSDSLAIVEQANQKMLVNIHTQHVMLDSLDGITHVESTLGTVGLVQRNGFYGIINKQGNLLLPTHFEELTIIDTDAEKIVLAIEPINETRKQVSYRKLNGTIIFTFQTTPEIALKLLCD
jgi:hypothetical protein